MHRLQDLGRDPRETDRLNLPAFVAALDPARKSSNAHDLPYRGRFAPSPTGPLHLGSLFTALASYLQARAHGGAWLIRIDDVDCARSVPGAADAILATLERFSLFWDGAVVYQSQRTAHYQAAVERLSGQGRLYACTCARKSLVQWPRYPGLCRGRPNPTAMPHALRLITEGEVVTVLDGLQGAYSQDFDREIGDFIVRRSDGIHAYHLATVVDDAEAGITEVVRGVDLLESTPRQVLLQRALNFHTPAYLHLPLLVDKAGIKLSKQTGAAPVDVRKPGELLYSLLPLLGLSPPCELSDAPSDDLVNWAVASWDQRRLHGKAIEIG